MNPSKTQELFMDLVKSAKYELLLILPTTNSFLREYTLGIINLLLEQAVSSTSSEHNVNVRILAPTNDNIEKIIQDVVIAAGEDQEAGKKQAENFTTYEPTNIRNCS